MGVEIYSKTLGIIGCGNIGSIVAERAIGLRMRVVAFDPFLVGRTGSLNWVSKKSSSKIFSGAPTSSPCTRR